MTTTTTTFGQIGLGVVHVMRAGAPICAVKDRPSVVAKIREVEGPASCHDCESRLAKEAADARPHRLIVIQRCVCGEEWPCVDARDETTCQAFTNSGKPCMRPVWLQDRCQLHWEYQPS